MADGDERGAQAFTYDAFISYRHVGRDRKWAEWLIAALESYRVPKALQDKGVPPRLRKVYRDEDEILASSDLSDQIKQALKASRFLIVVCSPYTPRSEWVAREIEMFNEFGRGDQVLALLTEGEPRDSFPTVLLERHRRLTEPDGSVRTVKEAKEPMAADVRPQRGVPTERVKRFALLRLVACILGVSFDDLRRREHERARRRRLTWAAVAAVLCVAIGGTGLGYWEMTRPKTAHYRQLAWRWGLPDGVGAIDQETYSHRAASYSVTTVRGKVMETRRENSAGALRSGNSLRSNDDGQARWVVHYRDDGSADRIEIFDQADRLVREDLLRRQASKNKLIVTFERNDVPLTQAATQNLVFDPLNAAPAGTEEGAISRAMS
jgi:TIR domain